MKQELQNILTRIAPEVHETLRQHAFNTRVSSSFIVSEALRIYLLSDALHDPQQILALQHKYANFRRKYIPIPGEKK